MMDEKYSVRTLPPEVVKQVRKHNYNNEDPEHPVYSVEERKGTGKATCRNCNKPIESGESSILFQYAHDDERPWMRQRMLVHKDECGDTSKEWTRCPKPGCGQRLRNEDFSVHWKGHIYDQKASNVTTISTGTNTTNTDYNVYTTGTTTTTASSNFHIICHCGQCQEDKGKIVPFTEDRDIDIPVPTNPNPTPLEKVKKTVQKGWHKYLDAVGYDEEDIDKENPLTPREGHVDDEIRKHIAEDGDNFEKLAAALEEALKIVKSMMSDDKEVKKTSHAGDDNHVHDPFVEGEDEGDYWGFTGTQACDYGHYTSDARRLPIGGNAGVWVCQEHYAQEMQSRQERRDERGTPAWEVLEKQASRIAHDDPTDHVHDPDELKAQALDIMQQQGFGAWAKAYEDHRQHRLEQHPELDPDPANGDGDPLQRAYMEHWESHQKGNAKHNAMDGTREPLPWVRGYKTATFDLNSDAPLNIHYRDNGWHIQQGENDEVVDLADHPYLMKKLWEQKKEQQRGEVVPSREQEVDLPNKQPSEVDLSNEPEKKVAGYKTMSQLRDSNGDIREPFRPKVIKDKMTEEVWTHNQIPGVDPYLLQREFNGDDLDMAKVFHLRDNTDEPAFSALIDPEGHPSTFVPYKPPLKQSLNGYKSIAHIGEDLEFHHEVQNWEKKVEDVPNHEEEFKAMPSAEEGSTVAHEIAQHIVDDSDKGHQLGLEHIGPMLNPQLDPMGIDLYRFHKRLHSDISNSPTHGHCSDERCGEPTTSLCGPCVDRGRATWLCGKHAKDEPNGEPGFNCLNCFNEKLQGMGPDHRMTAYKSVTGGPIKDFLMLNNPKDHNFEAMKPREGKPILCKRCGQPAAQHDSSGEAINRVAYKTAHLGEDLGFHHDQRSFEDRYQGEGIWDDGTPKPPDENEIVKTTPVEQGVRKPVPGDMVQLKGELFWAGDKGHPFGLAEVQSVDDKNFKYIWSGDDTVHESPHSDIHSYRDELKDTERNAYKIAQDGGGGAGGDGGGAASGGDAGGGGDAYGGGAPDTGAGGESLSEGPNGEGKPSFGPVIDSQGTRDCPRCGDHLYSIGGWYSCARCGWANYRHPKKKRRRDLTAYKTISQVNQDQDATNETNMMNQKGDGYQPRLNEPALRSQKAKQKSLIETEVNQAKDSFAGMQNKIDAFSYRTVTSEADTSRTE